MVTKTVFLWSILFTFASWSIEEEQINDSPHTLCNLSISSLEASSFKDSPTEIVQYVLNFLPMECLVPVSQVCKDFHTLANNEQGPFKDFIALKIAYRKQKEDLLKIDFPKLHLANIQSLGQVLSNLRKSIQTLATIRSKEELTGLVTQLFMELKTQDEKLNHFTEKKSNLRKLWPPLALLRACDAFCTSEMKDWLNTIAKNKAIFPNYYRPSLVHNLFRCKGQADVFLLLGDSPSLTSIFTIVNLRNNLLDEKDAYFLALELCERDSPSINAVIDVAEHYFHYNDWLLAASYYSIALKKSPDLSPEVYVNAAITFELLHYWDKALKYAIMALEKSPDPYPYLYTCIGSCYKAFKNWTLALKYYSLAIENNPHPDLHDYESAGNASLHLGDWLLATDYYNLAIIAGGPLCPEELYLRAGYAAVKAKQSKAVAYFERFITYIEQERPYVENTDYLYDYGKDLPDVLTLMEEVLTTSNSTVPFQSWISHAKKKRLKHQKPFCQ